MKEIMMVKKDFFNLGRIKMSEFSKILIKTMDVLHMTEEDCARLIDVSSSTIKRWVEGSTEPNDLVIMLIYKSLLLETLKAR